MSEAEYTIRDIEVLTGPESVRRRPDMCLGHVRRERLLWGVVERALDEFTERSVTPRIRIELLPDGGCRVEDNGPGLVPDSEILRLLFSRPQDTAPFRRCSSYLHGMSLLVTSSLSQRLEGETRHAGTCWRFALERGQWTEPPHRIDPCATSGTALAFWPDPSIFEGPPSFDSELVRERVQELAFLHPRVTFTLEDAASWSPTTTFQYPEGTVALVAHLAVKESPVHPEIFHCRVDEPDHRLDVAWAWTESADLQLRSFANGRYTRVGGTHEAGFRAALCGPLRRWALGRNIGDAERWQNAWSFVRSGLVAGLALDLPDPRFLSACGDNLGNPEAAALVRVPVAEAFSAALEADPEGSDALCRHLLMCREATILARQLRAAH